MRGVVGAGTDSINPNKLNSWSSSRLSDGKGLSCNLSGKA